MQLFVSLCINFVVKSQKINDVSVFAEGERFRPLGVNTTGQVARSTHEAFIENLKSTIWWNTSSFRRILYKNYYLFIHCAIHMLWIISK